MSDTNSNFQMQAANAGEMTVNRLEIGDALGGAIRLFRSNLGLFMLISLLGGLLGAVLLFFTGGTKLAVLLGSSDVAALGATMTSGLVFWFLLAALYVLVQAVMLSVALTSVRGGRPDLGGALREGLRALPKLFAISILFWLGYMVLGMFLWIPGLIFMIVFYVVKPAAMAEGLGIFSAYGRARELSRGNRWAILGSVFLMGLILCAVMVVAMMGLGIVFGFMAAMTDIGAAGVDPSSMGTMILLPLTIYLFLVWVMLILMTCLDATIYHGLATPHALDRTEASRVFD